MLSPSYLLHRLCVHSLPCTTRPWGRATGDGHHQFIRLHHTGRAHPARLKRDTPFQGYAAGVSSTCHAGLLAPEARGVHGVAHFGVVPRESRPRTRGAVVFVEYLSRTLSASWQLCRKCNRAPLRDACLRVPQDPFFHDASAEPLPDQPPNPPIIDPLSSHCLESGLVYTIELSTDIGIHDPADALCHSSLA